MSTNELSVLGVALAASLGAITFFLGQDVDGLHDQITTLEIRQGLEIGEAVGGFFADALKRVRL